MSTDFDKNDNYSMMLTQVTRNKLFSMFNAILLQICSSFNGNSLLGTRTIPMDVTQSSHNVVSD